MTPPMLKCLKEGGEILHRQVPLEYLPVLLEIVSYSFTDNIQDFEAFLVIVKDSFMAALEKMHQSGFINLLSGIS
jgi:hypothetical protein